MVQQVQPWEVCVFYPSDSLLLAMAGWLRHNPSSYLRLTACRHPDCVKDILLATSATIIDATGDWHDAEAVLRQSLELVGPDRIAVYTEQQRRHLEIDVRQKGVPFYLGPLSGHECHELCEQLKGRTALV